MRVNISFLKQKCKQIYNTESLKLLIRLKCSEHPMHLSYGQLQKQRQ